MQPPQMWASAPDDGTLEAWKTWGAHVLSDNSTAAKHLNLHYHL